MVGIVRSLSGLRGLYVLALILGDFGIAPGVRARLPLAVGIGDPAGQPGDPPQSYDEMALVCGGHHARVRRTPPVLRAAGSVAWTCCTRSAARSDWLAGRITTALFIYRHRAAATHADLLGVLSIAGVDHAGHARRALREAHRRGRDLSAC